jgi:hypothetical protein
MRRAATSGRAVGALAAVAALAFSLSAFAAGDRTERMPRTFRLTGGASGLYPGAVGHVAVTVRNPYRRHLRVGSLRVRVLDAGPACRASNLLVKPFRGLVDVRPRRARVLRVFVRMAPSAGEGCRGARFPLRFSAKGVLW